MTLDHVSHALANDESTFPDAPKGAQDNGHDHQSANKVPQKFEQYTNMEHPTNEAAEKDLSVVLNLLRIDDEEDADVSAENTSGNTHTEQEKYEEKFNFIAMGLPRAEEEVEMRSTPDGQSWLLAREVLLLREKHKRCIGFRDIHPVAVDDLVAMAKKFLLLRQSFIDSGRPPLVTIGYHYTRWRNMDSIRENGLMTPEDEQELAFSSGRTGSLYGPGIYLSSNPYAFHSFNGGNVGLMVAVMFGRTCRVQNTSEAYSLRHTHDTVIGNKNWTPSFDRQSDRHCHFSDEYVLQKSAQCLPLFRFSAGIIDGHLGSREGNDLIWAIHEDCQKMIDSFMNCGEPTDLVRIRPTNSGMVMKANLGAVACGQSRYPKPPGVMNVKEGILRYQAPEVNEHSYRCLHCSTLVNLTYGTSPPGTMTITRTSELEPNGSDDVITNVIIVRFYLPDGIQKSYHPSPFRSYAGTSETVHLPDNHEGHGTLARLQYAWLHGLLFNVGDSMPYAATWSLLTQNSLDASCGAEGFGRWSHLSALHFELDVIGVPAVSELNGGNHSNLPAENTAVSAITTAQMPSRKLAERTSLKQSQNRDKQVLQYRACEHTPYPPPALMPPCPHCGCFRFSPLVGPCPSGTMTISRDSGIKLEGFQNSTTHTFVIQYKLWGGAQKLYHPNPGHPFSGTSRTAYLPDNDACRMLLERLKYAWLHGLTFTIGKSKTTGLDNVITWSCIHHKTSLGGGVYGFPDPSYFTRVNAELDIAGVPSFSSSCATSPHNRIGVSDNYAEGSAGRTLLIAEKSSSASRLQLNDTSRSRRTASRRSKSERRLLYCESSSDEETDRNIPTEKILAIKRREAELAAIRTKRDKQLTKDVQLLQKLSDFYRGRGDYDDYADNDLFQ